MKEYFEERTLTGSINVACKFEDQPTRYWTTTKEEVSRNIVAIVKRYIQEDEILTLRQLHYQFVGHVPGYVNHDSAYKKLGNILDDLRYCGVVPWNAFEDRGRKPYIPYSVGGPAEALQDAVDYFRIDRQEGQNVCVELWTEKDALSAIFKKSTERFHIRLVINKGYTSSTAAYEAYRRFLKAINEGKKVVVLYFGDHDPSGLDMVRDIKDRLLFFLCRGELNRDEKIYKWMKETRTDIWEIAEYYGEEKFVSRVMNSDPTEKDAEKLDELKCRYWIEQNDLFTVKHIGLTKEQIIQFRLPENPTKLTDSRANNYIKTHGKRCWEVDALDIAELRSILDTNIVEAIDSKLFNKVIAREKKERKLLEDMIKQIKK